MREFTVRVLVEPKAGLLDPQGKAVGKAMRELGLEGVREVRVGKVIRFVLRAADPGEAEAKAGEMARKLLCNPLIEDFRIEIS